MKITIDICVEDDSSNPANYRTRNEVEQILLTDADKSSKRNIQDIMKDIRHLCSELLNYEAIKNENEVSEKKEIFS